ncbi:MAG TPA: hypothetical protein VGJ13_02510 [Pseudonocardiaceae bacterium]
MRTPMTLLAFIAGLIVLFAVAIGVGESLGPIMGNRTPATPGGDGAPGNGSLPQQEIPAGVSVSDRGYVLWPSVTRFSAGDTDDFSFTIFTLKRALVTTFAVDHGQRMHIIVVRRDLTDYQELDATMASDGTWTAPLRLAEPGSYRAFAIFRPEGVAEPITLGVDLEAPGLVNPRAIPQPSTLARADEYTVMLEGDVIAGGVARLYANVLRNDDPIVNLEPYQGAPGHLVMLREGDLALLQVRPVPDSGAKGTISFEASIPTAGYYRVFLDFKHEGEVHTAQFTVMAS